MLCLSRMRGGTLLQGAIKGFGARSVSTIFGQDQAGLAHHGQWLEKGRAIAIRLSQLDWTTDLGTNLGSHEWWRGLFTCATLCGVTLAFAPGIRPLETSVASPLNGQALDEARAQSVAPLAWGGDSGKRLAASALVIPLAAAPERPTVDLVATMGQGDGFARALQRAGVAPRDAERALGLVASVADPSAIAPGTVIPISLGERPAPGAARPLQSLQMRAAFDLKVSIVRSAQGLVLTKIPILVDNTPLRIRGRFGDSLYRSARAAGIPPKAVETYIRAVAEKVTFEGDVSPYAIFDMVVENERAATGETRAGRLLYAGFEQNGRRLHMQEWTIGGRTQWFDAAGVAQQRAGMVSPVNATRISSGFGLRFHPILGYSRFHRGVDFAAVYGSPIRAVTDGIVATAGWAGGHGQRVQINHAGALGSSYSHMSRIVVSPGQTVQAGQLIGYVGSTGLSTGPHLHFEVYKNGAVVNPGSVSFASASLLSGRELEAFRARMAALLDVPVTGG